MSFYQIHRKDIDAAMSFVGGEYLGALPCPRFSNSLLAAWRDKNGSIHWFNGNENGYVGADPCVNILPLAMSPLVVILAAQERKK